ncbi:MAG: hypothetical protein ACI9MB_005209, partial [Verrucomicrobiales bacterium]
MKSDRLLRVWGVEAWALILEPQMTQIFWIVGGLGGSVLRGLG